MHTTRFLLLTLSAAALCACSGGSGDGHHEHSSEPHDAAHTVMTVKQQQAAHLTFETVQATPFAATLRVTGQVSRPQGGEGVVAATAAGIVRLTPSIAEGAAVSAGGRVATISARNLQDGDPVEKARAAYAAAEYEMNRLRGLAQDKIVSQCDYDRARLAFETARATYDGLARAATAQGVAVTAQMGGYVKALAVRSGSYVNVGDPIATVAADRRLTLVCDVPEACAAQLPKVVSANFRTVGGTVRLLADMHGRLVARGRSVAEGTALLPVTFEFDNVGDVTAGAFADVWLVMGQRESVLTVPLSALTEEQGVHYVYVRTHADSDDAAFEKREVTLGQDNGVRVEVTSGLRTGDVIVASHPTLVRLASLSGTVPEGHSHNH